MEIFFCVFFKTKISSILFSDEVFLVCLFVSQGDFVVVGKKTQFKENEIRGLVTPNIISECSGQYGLFSLKGIPSCFGPGSCNNQYLTEYYFMPKE